MFIGEKVKELRKRQKMSLSELADKSGVQIATLSRIEHKKMPGTIESHLQIAKALGVDITVLYSNIALEEEKPEVKTSKSSADMFVHSSKSSYEILANKVLNKRMLPALFKIEPGGSTNKEQGVKGSEKFIFILDGKIDVKIDGESYQLSKNNSLYFDASLEHRFINSGKTTAKMLCVATPVTL